MDFENSLISASNAASMLRRKVAANQGALDKVVIESNNAKVDEFEQLLKEVGDMNNKVPASLVWHYWQVFEQGLEYKALSEAASVMNLPDEDCLEYWKNFFSTSSMEMMVSMGVSFITFGWSMIILNYIRQWIAAEKARLVYSVTDDRAEWLRLSRDSRKLWEGDVLPFWDKEQFQRINDMVRSISSIRVAPRT